MDVTQNSSTAFDLEIPRDQASRERWFKTGDPREPEQAEAASANETKEPSAPQEGESAPAPEAGTIQEKSRQEPRQQQRSNAETRIRDLAAKNKKSEERIAALERQLADSHRPKTQADPSPAQPSTQVDSELKPPTKPKWEDYQGKSMQDWEAARDEYQEKMADYKAEVKLREYQQRQQQTEHSKYLLQQEEIGNKAYPDFYGKTAPITAEMNKKEFPGALSAAIVRSHILPHLVYALGAIEKARFDALVQEAKTDPVSAIKKLARFEAEVERELANSGKQNAQRTEKTETTAKEKTPEKKVTSAPKNISEAKGNGSPPRDEMEEALEKGDDAAYLRLANARDLQKRKKG